MVTVVNKLIKNSGGNYTDLNAFFAAAPSNLVTADEQWVATVDGEITFASTQVCGAKTTDATRNIIVQAAAGQGTAALIAAMFYDGTKGGALKCTSGTGNILEIPVDFTQVIGLQCLTTNTNSDSGIILLAKSCSAVGNLIDLAPISGAGRGIKIGNNSSGDTPIVKNNVTVTRSPGSKAINVNFSSAGTIAGNTLYSTASGSNTAIQCEATGPVIKDNAIFGFTTPVSGGNASTTNNATDAASISSGSGNLVSQSFSACFTSTTDLRVKTGSPLIGAGVTVSGLTTDVFGQTRAAPPTIGAAEPVAPPPTENLVGANATFQMTSTTGAATVTPPAPGTVNLAASNCTFQMASTTGVDSVTPVVGTVTTEPFTAYGSASPLVGITVPRVEFLRLSDGVQVLNLANQVTNGTGCIVAVSAALVAGVDYVVVSFDATGANIGALVYRAA